MHSQIRAELVQLQDLTKTLKIMISFMQTELWIKLHNDPGLRAMRKICQEMWQRAYLDFFFF